MGQMTNAYKVSVGKPEGERCSEDLDVDGRITSELCLKKERGKMWARLFWFRTGNSGGLS
jgi:hypothetical protein